MTPKKPATPDVTEIHAVEGDEAPDVEIVRPDWAVTARGIDQLVQRPPLEAAAPLSHPLDSAPVNSKIVLVRTEGVLKAVLATPDEISVLDPSDPASKLPEGASIRKIGAGKFVAWQLSPAVDYPAYQSTSASEAIAGFVPHFHRAT